MLSYINNVILGPILPILLLMSGAFLLIRLRFFIFVHPIRIIKSLFSKKSGEISPFKAACVALSGTLGVGNIAGVAAAIYSGGAGAIFWMWVSAFFAMIIKYAEVCIAMVYKKNGKGGASYYIEKGLKNRPLAVIFAVITVISSLSVGNIVQSSAAAEAMKSSFGLPKLAVGTVFAVITLYLLRNGVKSIAGFSSTVIPILSAGYVVLSFAIMIKNADMLPSVLGRIVGEAFDVRAAHGGILGFFTAASVRYGASRGILSNEAGCGTAAYAHASADNSPCEQGFFGIFEVFVDTVLLCTMTAFVVLIAFPQNMPLSGMAAASMAYGIIGSLGGDFISISSAIYAVASVVCWSFYGTEGLVYLGASPKVIRGYVTVYSLMGVVGACTAPALVWEIADLSVSVMALINTVCICLLSGICAKQTRKYFGK